MAGAVVRLQALGVSLEFETRAAGSAARTAADAAADDAEAACASAAAPLAGVVWDAALVVFHYLTRQPPGFTRCARAERLRFVQLRQRADNTRLLAGESLRVLPPLSWAPAPAWRAWRWRCWARACC